MSVSLALSASPLSSEIPPSACMAFCSSSSALLGGVLNHILFALDEAVLGAVDLAKFVQEQVLRARYRHH
jgi:hypothetical protein